jgi:DNA-directed RNA polymerase subunit RPC12/RpoP
MITAQCTSCGTHYRVQDEMAGKSAKCKKCGGVVQIPSAAASSSIPMGSDRETIKYKCPKCSGKLENPGTMGGREDECPLCGFVHPVPLSKGQQKELQRRREVEATAAKTAAVRQQREQAERARREQEAARSLTPATGAPPPLAPPPIDDGKKRTSNVAWYVAGGIVAIAAVSIVAGVILPGWGTSDGPVPVEKAQAADVDSLKDFALVARQLRTGLAEGITFRDFDEKQSKLRDAYALIDRQKVPASLVRKAEETFEQAKELREIWRKHIYESEYVSWEDVLQLQMGITGKALDSFLGEYDRVRLR